MYPRRLEQRYMDDQKEIEADEPDTTTPWLVNNILFCYEGETHIESDSERRRHFLQQK